jgi:peptidoglycan hydrolase-like protein with peptidoglycan-binding domain
MAEEIIGVKVKVDAGDVGKSVGSLKQQLREAQNDVTALSEKFGATSKEAINAAKRAAELKDAIGDAKALTDAFNPDAKFKALTASLSGVAGGFAALQGAVGLFGKQTEAVEKTLLKVQSAMALSQGLQAVGESIDSFKQLGAVIGSGVSKAFGTLRSAIISTGIGALVVGVGLLIANFETVKKVVLNFIPGLGKLADFVGNLVTKFTDFVGITSEADRVLEKLSKTNAKANENIEARVKLLTAQGGKEKEIYALQKEANANETNALRERLKLTGKLTEEEAKRFRELKVESAVLDATEQKRIADRNAQAAKDAAAKQAERDKARKEREEGEELIRRDKELAANLTKTEILGVTAAGKDALIQTQVVAKGVTNAIVVSATEQADAKKTLTDYEKKLDQEKFDAQLGLAQQTLSIVGGLVDQNSVAGKAIAVTQAIINTYQGASKAIAQGGIFGPVAAAATIAAGLINVKKIISTKVPSAKGTGNVAEAGAPSMSMASAPISPSAPIQNTVTSLSQQSINQMGSATGRAYVVESDITNQQEKIIRINRAARLG